jgi:hypothetical protein
MSRLNKNQKAFVAKQDSSSKMYHTLATLVIGVYDLDRLEETGFDLRNWISIIQKTCNKLLTEEFNNENCWLFEESARDKGYFVLGVSRVTFTEETDQSCLNFLKKNIARIKKKEGYVQMNSRKISKEDILKGMDGTVGKTYYEKVSSKKVIPLYSFFKTLLLLYDDEEHIKTNSTEENSHLCFKCCFNPHHVVYESKDCNIGTHGRKACRHGCRLLCPHETPCIWTNMKGSVLPCRNKNQFGCDEDCSLDCFNSKYYE